jgi:hypothetical protein
MDEGGGGLYAHATTSGRIYSENRNGATLQTLFSGPRGHSRSSPKARLLLVDPGWGETARHKNKWNQLRIVRARLRSRLGRIALSPSACTPTKGISRSINGAAGGQRQPLISAAQFDLASRLVDDHKQARDRWRFRVRRSLCSRPARTTQEQAAALLNYQTEYLAEKFHGTAN